MKHPDEVIWTEISDEVREEGEPDTYRYYACACGCGLLKFDYDGYITFHAMSMFIPLEKELLEQAHNDFSAVFDNEVSHEQSIY